MPEPWQALKGGARIKRAFLPLRIAFETRGRALEAEVEGASPVLRLEGEGVWAAFRVGRDGQFHNPFGTELPPPGPKGGRSLVRLSPETKPDLHRRASLLAFDGSRRPWLLHAGLLRDVPLASFASASDWPIVQVARTDGTRRCYRPVCDLTSDPPEMVRQACAYVRECARIAAVAPPPADGPAPAEPGTSVVTRETLAAMRRLDRVRDAVGLACAVRGLEVGRPVAAPWDADLSGRGEQGLAVVVALGTDAESVQRAMGRLCLGHPALDPSSARVMVLPEGPLPEGVEGAIRRSGIALLRHGGDGESPTFSEADLDAALPRRPT